MHALAVLTLLFALVRAPVGSAEAPPRERLSTTRRFGARASGSSPRCPSNRPGSARIPPGHGETFSPDEEVVCSFKPDFVSGSTPKFECERPNGKKIKVKYGRDNAEIYAEVAASRLLSALGFPADRMYVVKRVRCFGCPPDPFKGLQCLNEGGSERRAVSRTSITANTRISTTPSSNGGWRARSSKRRRCVAGAGTSCRKSTPPPVAPAGRRSMRCGSSPSFSPTGTTSRKTSGCCAWTRRNPPKGSCRRATIRSPWCRISARRSGPQVQFRQRMGEITHLEGCRDLHRLDASSALWRLELSRHAHLRGGPAVSRQPARETLLPTAPRALRRGTRFTLPAANADRKDVDRWVRVFQKRRCAPSSSARRALRSLNAAGPIAGRADIIGLVHAFQLCGTPLASSTKEDEHVSKDSRVRIFRRCWRSRATAPGPRQQGRGRKQDAACGFRRWIQNDGVITRGNGAAAIDRLKSTTGTATAGSRATKCASERRATRASNTAA